MKKDTKFRRSPKPRGRRRGKRGRSPLGEITSLREQLRATPIGEIRSAVATTGAELRGLRRVGILLAGCSHRSR